MAQLLTCQAQQDLVIYSDHISLLFQVEPSKPKLKYYSLPIYSKDNYDNTRNDEIVWKTVIVSSMTFIRKPLQRAVELYIPTIRFAPRNKAIWMDKFALRKVKLKHSKCVCDF